MCGEEGDHAVESGRHGVEATEQQEVADAEELRLAQGFAIDRRVNDARQQTVRGLQSATGNEVAKVLSDLVRHLGTDALGAFEIARLHCRPDRIVPPAQKEREVLLGQSHERQKELGWQRCRDLLVKVALPAGGNPIDEAADDSPYFGLQLSDLPGNKLWAQQTSVLRVLGGIELEGDQRLIAKVEAASGRSEVLGMTEGPGHIVIARNEHRRASPHGGAGHWTLLTEAAIGSVGVIGNGRCEEGMGGV